MQIRYYADNFTIDPSIAYNSVVAQIYNPETGEWVTEYNGAHAGNGLVEEYGQQYIVFNSQNAATFTFRLYVRQNSTNVAISEAFTVTWAAKKFTTQPQGDMVVVGDTVTVTADKNFYVKKYEIEYKDGGVWKLYQEVDATGKEWDAFSFDFTSDVAKSVTFRLKAYADVFDEEQDEWIVGLIDTSDEFTITWTSNEHVHTYGAIPNGKDETSHWKECTDPACPDKQNSIIEKTPHKAIGGDCQNEAACACGEMILGAHILSKEWTQENGQHFQRCMALGCTYTHERDYCSGGAASCTSRAVCEICGGEYGELAPHSHGTAWESDEGEHWNECACGDKANKAAHTDSNNDGKCDTCEYQMTGGGSNTETPDDPDNTPDDPGEDKGGLGAGAIVGIVIGSALVLGVGGFSLVWFVFKKKNFADLIAIFKK